MGYLNKVLLIGKLGHTPEKKTTPAGKDVVNIDLATSETWKDKSGQKQEKTEWHKLIFWDKLAGIVSGYCKKGSQIFVEGSLQTRDWQDKDGNKRYTTEIVVRSMQMLDSRSEQNQNASAQSGPEDGIPF